MLEIYAVIAVVACALKVLEAAQPFAQQVLELIAVIEQQVSAQHN
jgi:hypothetical protein